MPAQESDSLRNSTSRCLFCASTENKRSREHVFRRKFKDRFGSNRGLTFTYTQPAPATTLERPISQFDITVNHVCVQCNRGWLNELENLVEPIIDRLTSPYIKCELNLGELQTLGYWAYIRALLVTHASPAGHAPSELFEDVYATRTVPRASYVQLGTSTHYIFPAAAHQSFRTSSDRNYVGYVGFGLGRLVFLIAISDSSPVATEIARDVAAQPRRWFPSSLCWLSPLQEYFDDLIVLDANRAMLAANALGLSIGLDAYDHLGNTLILEGKIPHRFLDSMKRWDLNWERP